MYLQNVLVLNDPKIYPIIGNVSFICKLWIYFINYYSVPILLFYYSILHLVTHTYA
ncbi:hypothetical protein HanIR_Chr08g0374531 [Helianthus annuus]|nr:hypothetical protein HanIR_Chr08g0374531 [Helianthus annuus]